MTEHLKSDTQKDVSTVSDHTLVLRLGYRGAGFSGFARQPGLRTVQGQLERALSIVLRREVATTCAGRTDAGVHALAQVVSCDGVESDPSPFTLVRSLNALCGPDISISAVARVPEGFSARFDACAREYRYRIAAGAIPPLFIRDIAWWMRAGLDIDAMAEGAVHLLGENDFKSFCTRESSEGKSTTRFLETVSIEEAVHLGEPCIEITVIGNAFLHSMVRVIVGTLVEVGTGRRGPEWVGEVLRAQDRRAAGPTAPAQGLTLWSVTYPSDPFAQPTIPRTPGAVVC